METEKKSQHTTKSKKSNRRHKKYEKTYKTDIESCEDADMDCDMSNDGGHSIIKHAEQKKAFN